MKCALHSITQAYKGEERERREKEETAREETERKEKGGEKRKGRREKGFMKIIYHDCFAITSIIITTRDLMQVVNKKLERCTAGFFESAQVHPQTIFTYMYIGSWAYMYNRV